MNWLTWSLLSALFAALTAILAKVGVAGVDSNLATAIRTTVVLIFTWVLVIMSRSGSVSENTVSRKAWVFLVLSGLATGLSWICYFRALQLGPASRVAPVDKLSVVFVLVIAAIGLHEPMGWKQWLGGGLMAVGAITLASN